MTAPTPPTISPPPSLTATQARTLLQTLLSTPHPQSRQPTPNQSHRPTPKPVHKLSRHQQQQTLISTHQTITIDASTRVMGHCNNIQLSSSSAMDQATRIQELVRGVLADAEKKSGSISLTVQTGINVMGSRNVVLLGSGAGTKGWETNRGFSKNEAVDGSGGRKRKAEEPVNVDGMSQKKVKVDAEI